MMETDRVLRPLQEAEPAIERLDTYDSPAALTEALRAIWHAVDRALRALLRSDASAPDSIRMTAMSPEQTSAEAVMLELRRRELISLTLAGRIHELRQALDRGGSDGVRAADADNAREVVRRLREEVSGAAQTESAHDAPGNDSMHAQSGWTGPHGRPLVLAAVAAVILVAGVAAVVLFSGVSEMDRGIAAFGDDRPAVAEQHFRAVLQTDEENNTARLYLARILRRDGRHREAGELLQASAAHDAQDTGVRRELGYLFLDLDRPQSAARQFRQAVEIDADDPLNWVGMVQALALSGDSAGAAEWLRRAPAAAREMMGKPVR